jgi:hypothetical protein
MRGSIIAAAGQSSENTGFSFSLDLGSFHVPISTFRWEGISWTADILLSRLALFGVARPLARNAARSRYTYRSILSLAR